MVPTKCYLIQGVLWQKKALSSDRAVSWWVEFILTLISLLQAA